MRDILEEIAANKRLEVEVLKSQLPITTLEQEIGARGTNAFRNALAEPSAIHIIAEMKKGSPSRGLIAPDFDPAALADKYHQGGAAALSVLTENKYFYGRYEHIALAADLTALPVLCKDFVVDPYQLYHAAYIGAAAVLLIVRLHSIESLREL
ncbi:MAG: indole-3-glycerol-phosphate synthase TrpC, partial [candidate division Zixibacteria bacterium]|nr:indole-3-glycerol-phosphate synthase TrpC [candidate division Zixibacteria bacterium]